LQPFVSDWGLATEEGVDIGSRGFFIILFVFLNLSSTLCLFREIFICSIAICQYVEWEN
jgi:hypothetical protein